MAKPHTCICDVFEGHDCLHTATQEDLLCDSCREYKRMGEALMRGEIKTTGVHASGMDTGKHYNWGVLSVSLQENV